MLVNRYDIKYILVPELLEQSLPDGFRRQQADAQEPLEQGVGVFLEQRKTVRK